MMQARFFDLDEASSWDNFCRGAHGATFLHSRAFLSYHGTRFIDRSVVIEQHGEWLGVIPAAGHAADPSTVVSHPGATYGGIVHQGRLRGTQMLHAFDSARALWASAGYERLQYKAVPHIYQAAPAQEDLYALFRAGAVRYRVDLSSCIDLRCRLPVSERRKRGKRKAQRACVQVVRGRAHLAALWLVLADNLMRNHGVAPVHTLDEISLLVDRFPEHIHVMTALVNGVVEAGIVLFLGQTVAHAQYIASSEVGYSVNALDLLFDEAIGHSSQSGKRYFDFGISTEDQGLILNDGLAQFKNEFGAGGVVHEFYELNLKGAGNASQ
ncbi:GNAT family N-acetyltransferase [Massilia sp. CMS3.1]|uniref:GNAT family N-acetyltransferase n=1 Tax=Massilia sp. CMS3.1 TaxID=3373083 RepID=UPI003EE70B28